jgi:hypothetical protein
MTPEFLSALAALGWRYVSLKGRLGARFERMIPAQAEEAIAV